MNAPFLVALGLSIPLYLKAAHPEDNVKLDLGFWLYYCGVMLPVALAVAAAAAWQKSRRWNAFVVTLEDDAIAGKFPGTEPTVIPCQRISALGRSARGCLVVLTRSILQRIRIPEGIDGYDEIVERLRAWGFDEPSRSPLWPLFRFYGRGLAIIAATAAYLYFHEPLIVVPIGVTLIGLTVMYLRSVLRDPTLTGWDKWRVGRWAVAGLLLLVLRLVAVFPH